MQKHQRAACCTDDQKEAYNSVQYSNIRGGVTIENAIALHKKKESNFSIFRVKSFLRGIKSTFILHRK